MYLVRTLSDLERIGHVHRARNARQVTFQFRIAVNPVIGVLLLDRQRFGCVRDLTVALHDTKRSGHAPDGAERNDGGRGHPRVLIRIDARLRHGARARLVGLQVPVRFVIGLPDSAEVGSRPDTRRP
jgi:hypothetical protein